MSAAPPTSPRWLSAAPTSAPKPAPAVLGPVNTGVLAIAALGTLALVQHVWSAHGAQPAVLLLFGVGLGIALFHSRFGFTSAWRQLVAVGNGAGCARTRCSSAPPRPCSR